MTTSRPSARSRRDEHARHAAAAQFALDVVRATERGLKLNEKIRAHVIGEAGKGIVTRAKVRLVA